MERLPLIDEKGRVLENTWLADGLYLMKLHAPGLVGRIMPGQFVHAKLPGMEGHILRRPFSVYDLAVDEGSLELLYQVVGFGTAHMAGLGAGQVLELIGPCGNTWCDTLDFEVQRALLVAGGVGAAPLFLLARRLIAKRAFVHVVMGAQSADALVCHRRYGALIQKRFGQRALSLSLTTDDGSFGHKGFTTDLVQDLLAGEGAPERPFDYVASCGPEPMMRKVASLALAAGVPCELSLERRMACGVGACLSCVVETLEGPKRACVDGPIFNTAKLVFP